MQCSIHRSYKGIKPPQCKCDECHGVYRNALKSRIRAVLSNKKNLTATELALAVKCAKKVVTVQYESDPLFKEILWQMAGNNEIDFDMSWKISFADTKPG
jgi:hypothetical protein